MTPTAARRTPAVFVDAPEKGAEGVTDGDLGVLVAAPLGFDPEPPVGTVQLPTQPGVPVPVPTLPVPVAMGPTVVVVGGMNVDEVLVTKEDDWMYVVELFGIG
jgi:hypothetical protein